jgi:cytochrome c553
MPPDQIHASLPFEIRGILCPSTKAPAPRPELTDVKNTIAHRIHRFKSSKHIGILAASKLFSDNSMKRSNLSILVGLALLTGGTALAIAADTVKGDPAKAISIVEKVCVGCHGMDGNSPVPNFPKLAGHHADYLLHEMQEYKEHHRDNEMMSPLMQDLSSADMANLAVYFATQRSAPGAVTQPALLALGKKIYLEGNPDSGVPSCDGCHEENGAGSARFPRVAGQNPEYVLEQFRLYASGKRKFGKKVMRTVAERITEQEAKAVAEYIASMP